MELAGVPHAEAPNPLQYLGCLETFLANTAHLTNQQLLWLQWMQPTIGTEKAAAYDKQITEEITQNVDVASTYLQELANQGINILVRNTTGMRRPLLAIGFETTDHCYSAGVLLQGEQKLWPLDGTNMLEIAFSRKPSPPRRTEAFSMLLDLDRTLSIQDSIADLVPAASPFKRDAA